MALHASDIATRLADIRGRIDRAARRAGREASDVLIVAVTKTHGKDTIKAAYEAGLVHFGENRVEEADAKIVDDADLPNAVWHMIGHIQSRKTDDVAKLFGWAHSVDRLKVARRLSTAAEKNGRTLQVLLQANISGEESKAGFKLSGWPQDDGTIHAFIDEARAISSLPHLHVIGLMTIAPYSENAEDSRPVFRRLIELRNLLKEKVPASDWQHLSMGMSGDFEVAVEEGATIVRLGTSLFGSRQTQAMS